MVKDFTQDYAYVPIFKFTLTRLVLSPSICCYCYCYLFHNIPLIVRFFSTVGKEKCSV